jgi:hypothetical protein
MTETMNPAKTVFDQYRKLTADQRVEFDELCVDWEEEAVGIEVSQEERDFIDARLAAIDADPNRKTYTIEEAMEHCRRAISS